MGSFQKRLRLKVYVRSSFKGRAGLKVGTLIRSGVQSTADPFASFAKSFGMRVLLCFPLLNWSAQFPHSPIPLLCHAFYAACPQAPLAVPDHTSLV